MLAGAGLLIYYLVPAFLSNSINCTITQFMTGARLENPPVCTVLFLQQKPDKYDIQFSCLFAWSP
jgi:hypothetical protein